MPLRMFQDVGLVTTFGPNGDADKILVGRVSPALGIEIGSDFGRFFGSKVLQL